MPVPSYKPDEFFTSKPINNKNINIEQWKDDEYIDLRNVGSGSVSNVKLMYQIDDQKIYAIKMPTNIKNKSEEYLTREYENYLEIDYPLLPKLYGIYKFENKYYLKIQFINGKTLYDLKDDDNYKFSIENILF